MPGTPFHLEVNPQLPPRLSRLEELANNLWYSWDRPTRTLFARLHPSLWGSVGHSPKAFLKRVDQQRLLDAADDPVFLGNYARVLSAYDTYNNEPGRTNGAQHLRQTDLIAYFCFEFGFHESLPIYSGGLGILAGDHCKAASDLRLPFVAVGLLFRQGYFLQTIDSEGGQHAIYRDTDFDDLPITPVLRDDGTELHVQVEMAERLVEIKVWQVKVGHVRLFLLDTDLEINSAHDRDIAHRLYGGDRTTRIEQEVVLGVGGVRALVAMGLKPTVWHINEGHAAFMMLERIRHLTTQGIEIAAAVEAVAAHTVFTTHTAVPAGHDHFGEDMIRRYFEHACKELGVSTEQLLALGRAPGGHDFNMTALAIRGSRFHNGVSRIHGGVSAHILSTLWPQIEPDDNPVTYVTNGVHVPTFLSSEWNELFDRFLGPGWTQRVTDRSCWEGIHTIPDHQFWSVHQSLKSQMLHLVRHRISEQHARNHGSEAHLDRLLKLANPDNPNVLTIGFARRFATYKRAALLFENLVWLREILCDPKRPVLFIFAGKAHPADQPGQALIRRVTEVSRMPEFEGKILLVEGYDLRFARRLVSGVDVWLNNPQYPLEACGTSGMKAAINGIPNLSVLDGWWGEGYNGHNGWGITPRDSRFDHDQRYQEESNDLLNIMEHEVLPTYFRRDGGGYSEDWVALSKASMKSTIPRFNAQRMLRDYVTKLYWPARQQRRKLEANGAQPARDLANWKHRVRNAWAGVSMELMLMPPAHLYHDDRILLQVRAELNGLQPADVRLECLLGRNDSDGEFQVMQKAELPATGGEDRYTHFQIELVPEIPGLQYYKLRMYPYNDLLSHPFEMGYMIWI